MTTSDPVPVIGLAPSDSAALALASAPSTSVVLEVQDLHDHIGPVLWYVGGDRFTGPVAGAGDHGAGGGGVRLDPLFTAHAVARRFPASYVLAATTPDWEHPFNHARRSLTLDHFLHGTTGVVVGSRDRTLDISTRSGSAWTKQAAGPELAAEFAEILRELGTSWPASSILADKEEGVFAEVDEIRAINHRGHYSVAGPLNVTQSRQTHLPLLWHAVRAPELPHAQRAAEALIVGPDLFDAARETGLPVLVEVGVDDLAAARTDLIGAAGLLARVDSVEQVPAVTASLLATEAPAGRAGTTLREHLRLPVPSVDTRAFTPAFSTH